MSERITRQQSDDILCIPQGDSEFVAGNIWSRVTLPEEFESEWECCAAEHGAVPVIFTESRIEAMV